MMRVALMLALTSCASREFEWRGVPSGHIACTHAESLDELHCVVNGKPFICIRDWRASVVECAPGSVMR